MKKPNIASNKPSIENKLQVIFNFTRFINPFNMRNIVINLFTKIILNMTTKPQKQPINHFNRSKKPMAFLACLFIVGLGYGQNLVGNSSFEDTISCPQGFEYISSSTGWYSSSQTPDYFNPCANSNFYTVGAPDNIFGYQPAFEGVSYAGICTFSREYSWVREVIGVQLSQPLITGNRYYVSSYISLADSSSFDCETNHFGFKFSTVKYDYYTFNPIPIDNFSHIKSDDIISDKLGWTKISGSFIADSNYAYLSIGNFYDSLNTDTSNCINYAYYFVDNVCVSSDSLTCNSTNSLASFDQEYVEIYPNPADDFIFFNKTNVKAIEYQIFNIAGEELQNGFIDKYPSIIDVSHFENGIYFIKIDKKTTKQLIINH